MSAHTDTAHRAEALPQGEMFAHTAAHGNSPVAPQRAQAGGERFDDRPLNSSARAAQEAAGRNRAQVLHALQEHPSGLTVAQLARATALHEKAVRRYLQRLLDGDQAFRDDPSGRWRVGREPDREKRDRRRGAHGLTGAEARERIAGKFCEICEAPAQANDHDHETGALRGVLCHRCNRLLGMAGDDTDYLRKATHYLNQYRGLAHIHGLIPRPAQAVAVTGFLAVLIGVVLMSLGEWNLALGGVVTAAVGVLTLCITASVVSGERP